MNKGIKIKYIGAVAIVLVFLYIGFQVYHASHDSIKSVIASKETIYDSVTTDAVFIRDEKVITSSKTGTMVYNVKDGSRVEKGGTIARVFSSESEANSYAQLNVVEKQIDYYENIILQSSSNATGLDVIDSSIQSSINNYIRALASGKLETAQEYNAVMIDNINNRKITIGESIDVNSILSELYAQRKNLESNITKNDSVIAEQAGYFVSSVNGTEGEADYAKATELSVANINNIIKHTAKKSAEKNAVGKIIESFDWYVACVVEDSDIYGLEEGHTINIRFTQADIGELDAKVVALNRDEENAHKVALIMKLDDMDANIAKMRSCQVEIRFNEYSGLKIPNDAIRAVTVHDEEENKDKTVKCVYVLSGNVVKQKYIDIIYTGEDYVLAKSNIRQTGYVRLYDRVIIKGEDLSDGKIVKYIPTN